MDELQPLYLAGYTLMILGLIGAVVPILPGPGLIWLGALVWAWGDNFQRVNGVELALLGVLALAAWGGDLWVTTTISRKAGISWKAIGGSMVGGIAGGLFLSQLPVVGTLFGALIGSLLGMWILEFYDKRSAPLATKAIMVYSTGVFLTTVLEVTLALAMIALLAWNIFWG
jgi:uncharacterized protein YqgC (DUF456 family)